MTDEDSDRVAEQQPGRRLHVLIANEERERLVELEAIVRSLGHDVTARATDASELAQLTHEHRPEVALVGLGPSSEHALSLIRHIVQGAACPVIVVLHEPDPDFVAQAAREGVFASVTQDGPDQYRIAIEIALARFSSFRNLEGAFGRRAQIERAKGILMERHQIDQGEAFELLRAQARRAGCKLTDIAAAVTDSHTLLPAVPRPAEASEPDA